MAEWSTATGLIRKVFIGLSSDDLKALRAVATTRTYPQGEVLCHQGMVEHTFYIVMEGVALVYQTLPDGQERFLDLKRTGEFFGEMALIENMPRTASVRAASDLAVLEITEEVFDAVVARSPAVATTIMRQLVRSLRDTDERAIGELRTKNEELARAYRELQEAQAQLVEREVLRHELEVAATVQRGLLPAEIPSYRGFAFAGHNTPARHVGGDLYDVLYVDEDHLGLLLADVSDKGVHAALYMAITRTLFQTWAKHTLSPVELAYQVHEGLLDASSREEMFVTAFYGVLDCRTHELRYVRAGQERPLWLRANGLPLLALPGDGRFLGQIEELRLREYTLTLAPGDLLVLFSDGVPDATNQEGLPFGTERLRGVVERARGKRPEHVVTDIVQAVHGHQGEAPPFDDMTILVALALPDGEEAAP